MHCALWLTLFFLYLLKMLLKFVSGVITKYDWDCSLGNFDVSSFAGQNISGSNFAWVTGRGEAHELRTAIGFTFESEHLIAAAGEKNANGELVVTHKINGGVTEHKLSADKVAAIEAHQQLQAINRDKRRKERQVQPVTVDVVATAA